MSIALSPSVLSCKPGVETGVTAFSAFVCGGPHWWQDREAADISETMKQLLPGKGKRGLVYGEFAYQLDKAG